MAVEFSVALRGYDRIEVDAFVDRVERTLAGTAGVDAVTPESIDTAAFSTVLRGYRVEEVDDYLDWAVAQLRAVRPRDGADPGTPLVWGADLIRDRAELMRCAELPEGRRFARTGPFTSGYAVADVDPFVERVRGTLTSVLTSEEVSGVRFGKARRGYDEAAVDEWLARVMSHLDRIDQ